MTRQRNTSNNPFLLSKGERNGLIGLLVLTLIIIILPTILINNAAKKYVRDQNFRDSLLLAQVDSAYQVQVKQYDRRPSDTKVQRADRKYDQIQVVNMNTAGKEELMSLPGIGEVFSERIIKYRERLGGFTNKSQLKEVYGMKEETYLSISKYLYCDKKVSKININDASEELLRSHPYIPYKLAKQIISYREKVHPYSMPEDMKALYYMNDTIFEKLSPYIRVE